MPRTVPVSPAAIAEIKKLRKAGHTPSFCTDGGDVVAQFYTAQHESCDVLANGEVRWHFTGEDAGVEAAIENYNHERSWSADDLREMYLQEQERLEGQRRYPKGRHS